jgi:hypothetical protein
MAIFSDGKDHQLREMTQRAIDTALTNSEGISLDIIVYEKTNHQYERSITVQNDKPFNYNRMINEFINSMSGYNKYIVCNNDLIFHKEWLTHLLEAKYPIVSPIDPTSKKQRFTKNTLGYSNKIHLSSWCFMIDKELWFKIGFFDEDFPFWYADDSFIEQLKKVKIPAMIIPASKVTHIRSKTLNTMSVEEKEEITTKQYNKFYQKYINK